MLLSFRPATLGAGVAHLLYHLGRDGVMGHPRHVIQIQGHPLRQLRGLAEVSGQSLGVIAVVIGRGDRRRVGASCLAQSNSSFMSARFMAVVLNRIQLSGPAPSTAASGAFSAPPTSD